MSSSNEDKGHDVGVPGSERPVASSAANPRAEDSAPGSTLLPLTQALEPAPPHYKRAFIRKLGHMKLHFYEMHDGKMALDADDAAAFFGVDMLVACNYVPRVRAEAESPQPASGEDLKPQTDGEAGTPKNIEP